MNEYSGKLSPLATLVVWASRRLTLGEKVVWYRDWTLDRGVDGCYAGATALSESLGGSVTPRTVETIRQRLTHLGLHERAKRPDGRNPGWHATLPPACARPRSGKEATGLAALLDDHIAAFDSGLTLQPRSVGPYDGERGVIAQAPSLGGKGGSLLSDVQTSLPSVVTEREEKEKGIGSTNQREKRGGEPESVADILRRRA